MTILVNNIRVKYESCHEQGIVVNYQQKLVTASMRDVEQNHPVFHS